jgi:hypothetical protein
MRIIESMWKVEVNKLGKYLRPDSNLVILQNVVLEENERKIIVNRAKEFKGKTYDWLQIVGFGLGYIFSLGGIIKPIADFACRNIQDPDREVCSTLVGVSYADVGFYFNESNSVHITPDDIDDWTKPRWYWKRLYYQDILFQQLKTGLRTLESQVK